MKEVLRHYVGESIQNRKTSLEIFKMAKHYWSGYIKPHLKTPTQRVAFLGANNTIEVKPIVFAVANKSDKQLRTELQRIPSRKGRRLLPYKSPDLGIQAVAFDYDVTPFLALKGTPFSKLLLTGNNLVQASFTYLPVSDQTFDLTVIRNPFFDELANQGDLPTAFQEFIRVTKPGGVLWMTFLSEDEYDIALHDSILTSSTTQLYSGKNELTHFDEITKETHPILWDSYILIVQKQ